MTYDFVIPGMNAGGAERISLIFARILKRNGHQVRFINLRSAGGGFSEWLQEDEFELISLNGSRSLSAISSLRNFLRNHRDDIVFTSLESSAIASLVACRLTGNPIIVRLPNMPTNQLRKGLQAMKIHIVKWVSRRLYHSAQTIIAQTEEMRKEAITYYHLPEAKVVTIHNPIDEDTIRTLAAGVHPFSNPGVNILTVGTIDYRKGTDTLLDAFAKVRQQIPHATLTILGQATGEYARRLLERWKGAKGVDFLGFQKNPYPYMAHCDVFVLPSRMEGFPNVLLEAMFLNKAVVATHCLPIIQELVHDGENGYVCPVDDADAMARLIVQALSLKDIHNTYHLFDQEKMLKVFEISH